MNKNAKCYYDSAVKLLLPVQALYDEIDGFKLMLGKQNYFFSGSGTPLNSYSTISFTRNKYSMNKMLEKKGFPVPRSACIDITEFQQGRLKEKIAGLSFPLVAKPRTGKLGRNVFCNIQTEEQLEHYLKKNIGISESIVIEEFHGGLNSYRVLILNAKVIGVIQRYPAHVIGDGKSSLKKRIEQTNSQRIKISDALAPIVVDEECHIRLNELGMDLSSIPKKNERIFLGYTSNASRGGSYRSLGISICKKNRQLLVRAASELNLNLVGFDIECTDINVPIEASQGVIIEANDGPSVRIHEYPMAGTPVRVSRKILLSLVFRHPWSYLQGLYKHEFSAFYMRSIFLATLLGGICSLLTYTCM